jgi:Holliday junction resolvasome RuvABC endonuclease subunit
MVKINQPTIKPKTICSIDASTNSIAFAIFEDDSLIQYGKINFVGTNTYEKVMDSGRKIRAFFKLYENIDAIVIEHTVFMNSPKTAADLALVQGAILASAGIDKIRSVAPITWQIYIGNPKLSKQELSDLKKQNSGKSEAWLKTYAREFRKQRTIKLIDIIYDRIVTDNDVADAIGIGHYAINNWDKLTR